MALDVGGALSKLRHDRGLSQRKAAQELEVSQALLSHYENGAREPRLEFIVRACEYYGVSADYLLGRTPARENPLALCSGEPDCGSVWRDAEMRRLILSVSALLTLLHDEGPESSAAARNYLAAVIYRLLRLSGGVCLPDEPETPARRFLPLCSAVMSIYEASLTSAPPADENDETRFKKLYPQLYGALRSLMSDTDIEISKYFAQG